MRLLVVALSVLPFCACSRAAEPPPARTAAPALTSVHTRLDPASCRQEVDRTDPNETPYLRCPGVGGFGLIVRRVEAGRQSIDIVGKDGQMQPLNYQEVVTRDMASLTGDAEWRVSGGPESPRPVALMVRVAARENGDDPAQVTRTLIAIAKVTPDSACVTDVIVEGSRSAEQLRGTADSARDRPCAAPVAANGDAPRL
jgi:hypothetical protein